MAMLSVMRQRPALTLAVYVSESKLATWCAHVGQATAVILPYYPRATYDTPGWVFT